MKRKLGVERRRCEEGVGWTQRGDRRKRGRRSKKRAH